MYFFIYLHQIFIHKNAFHNDNLRIYEDKYILKDKDENALKIYFIRYLKNLIYGRRRT